MSVLIFRSVSGVDQLTYCLDFFEKKTLFYYLEDKEINLYDLGRKKCHF